MASAGFRLSVTHFHHAFQGVETSVFRSSHRQVNLACRFQILKAVSELGLQLAELTVLCEAVLRDNKAIDMCMQS